MDSESVGAPSTAPKVPARVGGIQGAHDFQLNHSSISVIGGDSHSHTHVHYPVTAKDLKTIFDTVANFRKIHQDTLAKATPGTVVWLIDCEEFRLFIDVDGILKIMWGSGIPGAGKTILASIVIDKLEALARKWGNQICVAYVYIRYSDQNQLTVRSILEVLVKQTIERHPDCFKLAQLACAHHLDEGTRPTEGELLQLLRQFADRRKATFYVLDALDEAPVRIRLAIIQKVLSLGVRLFITSRPLPAIEAKFPTAYTFSILAQDQDLDLHINEKIEGSEDLQDLLQVGGPEFQEQLVTTVKAKCGGMFLHASLQLDALQQCFTVHDAMQVLEAFPHSIDEVYQQTWQRIIQSEPHHASLAKAVFVWVLNAKQPMTIDQLRHALATSPHTHSFESSRLMPEAALMSVCRGLITVDKESKLVRLVHYTAKRPLEDFMHTSFPHPHSLLAAVCIACLTDCGFQNKGLALEEELETTLHSNPLLDYAYHAWVFHTEESLELESVASRVSMFISGCRAFPDIRHYDGFYDYLNPLHVVSSYNLPIAFAGPHNAQDVNAQTVKNKRTPLHLACIRGHHTAAQSLLCLPGVLVNAMDRDGAGETALILACWKGDDGIVKLVLAHPDVNVNLADKFNQTALMCASHRGRSAVVKLLLAHPDIDVNQADSRGDTPLIIASRKGYHRIVKALLTHPNIIVNSVNHDEESALMSASRKGRSRVATLLLSNINIKANLVNNDGDTALHLAAFKGEAHIVELLLTHPDVKVNLIDECIDGGTALMRASERGDAVSVKHLLAHPEIDVNLADKRGDTPLIIASRKDFQEIVVLLLSHPSIQANLVNSDGDTALIDACRQGHGGTIILLLAHPNIEVNLLSNDGNTALLLATSRKGCARTVKALLAHPDIDVNLADEDGDTALINACREDCESIITLLLAHPNVKVNLTNRDGDTALLLAASSESSASTVKLLLAHPDTDVNCADEDGDTALINASREGFEGTVTLLLAHPAILVNLLNDGETALIAASSWDGNRRIVELLLAHPDIEVNQPGKHGNTALMVASCKGNLSIIIPLIAASGIDVNCTNENGDTAIQLAADNGQDIVCMLLEGSGINTFANGTYGGHSAMLVAVVKAHHAVVRPLQDYDTTDAALPSVPTGTTTGAQVSAQVIGMGVEQFVSSDLHISDVHVEAILKRSTGEDSDSSDSLHESDDEDPELYDSDDEK